MTVSTAHISVYTLQRLYTFTVSHDLPFRLRPDDLLAHSQGRPEGFTMKPFKGSSNKLGLLGFVSQSM